MPKTLSHNRRTHASALIMAMLALALAFGLSLGLSTIAPASAFAEEPVGTTEETEAPAEEAPDTSAIDTGSSEPVAVDTTQEPTFLDDGTTTEPLPEETLPEPEPEPIVTEEPAEEATPTTDALIAEPSSAKPAEEPAIEASSNPAPVAKAAKAAPVAPLTTSAANSETPAANNGPKLQQPAMTTQAAAKTQSLGSGTSITYTSKNGKVMIAGASTTLSNIVVKHNGKTLASGRDYTVSYLNNKKAGTATLVITGIGSYAGTVKSSFTIVGAPSVTYGAKNMPISSTSAWKLTNATWKLASGNAISLVAKTTTVKAIRQGSAVIEVYNLLNEKIGTQTINVYPLTGRVMLRSANTSGKTAKYLDVSGQSKKDGGNIIIWDKNSGLNQQFTFTLQKDGSYTITSANSGKLVDVSGQSKKDGGNVIQWKANNGKNQRWNLVVDAKDRISFVSVNSGKLIDVNGASKKAGANVIQWKSNGGLNQKWYIEAAPYKYAGASSMPLQARSEWTLDNCTLKVLSGGASISGKTLIATKAGTTKVGVYNALGKQVATKNISVYDLGKNPYFIRSAGKSNLAIDISGASTKTGGNAIVWTYNGQANQKWTFERQSDGTYLIRSSHSGLLLEAAGSTSASKKNGANIDQGSKSIADNKKWYLMVDASNKISFKNKRSEKLIDIDGAKYVAGRNVIQWTSNNGKNQKWTLSAAPVLKYNAGNYIAAAAVALAGFDGKKTPGPSTKNTMPPNSGSGGNWTVYNQVYNAMKGDLFKLHDYYNDCAGNVALAVKWSGVDDDFSTNYVVAKQREYLINSNKWTQVLSSAKPRSEVSESMLQPGDIIVWYVDNGGTTVNHSTVYTGSQAVTKKYSSSSSTLFEAGSSKWAHLQPYNKTRYAATKIEVYRRNNTDLNITASKYYSLYSSYKNAYLAS